MDIDEPGWPVIDDFFEHLGIGRKAETRRRYQRVRLRLYDFLDIDDMALWLSPEQVTLLAAEREFHREGAVWTLYGVAGLFQCAPGFVAQEQLPSTAAEARMQISVTNRLVTHLWRYQRDPGLVRPYREALAAVKRARYELECRLRGVEPINLDAVLAQLRNDRSED